MPRRCIRAMNQAQVRNEHIRELRNAEIRREAERARFDDLNAYEITELHFEARRGPWYLIVDLINTERDIYNVAFYAPENHDEPTFEREKSGLVAAFVYAQQGRPWEDIEHAV